jgi:hypothetical protein
VNQGAVVGLERDPQVEREDAIVVSGNPGVRLRGRVLAGGGDISRRVFTG